MIPFIIKCLVCFKNYQGFWTNRKEMFWLSHNWTIGFVSSQMNQLGTNLFYPFRSNRTHGCLLSLLLFSYVPDFKYVSRQAVFHPMYVCTLYTRNLSKPHWNYKVAKKIQPLVPNSIKYSIWAVLHIKI